MPNRDIGNDEYERNESSTAPHLQDETIEIELGDFDSAVEAFDLEDSSEFDFSADLLDPVSDEADFDDVDVAVQPRAGLMAGSRGSSLEGDVSADVSDFETVSIEPAAEDDFDIDSDGDDLVDDSGFQLEIHGIVTSSQPEVSNDNEVKWEAEAQKAVDRQDSSVEVVTRSPKWIVGDEQVDTDFANDDSDLEEHALVEATDSSFSLECLDHGDDDSADENSQMIDSVSPDSVVPDDFDAEDFNEPDFDDPDFQNEFESAGLPGAIQSRPTDADGLASHAGSDASEINAALNPLSARGADGMDNAAETDLIGQTNKLGQDFGLDEVGQSGASEKMTPSASGSVFSRLFGWLKSSPSRDASAGERAGGGQNPSDASRVRPIEKNNELASSDDSGFDFAEASTVDMTAIPTEQVSILENDLHLNDLPVENVFNLDRPSSIAALAAEAREFHDEVSNEEFSLSQVEFEEGQSRLSDSSNADRSKEGEPASNETVAANAGVDVDDLPAESSDIVNEQFKTGGSAADTLIDSDPRQMNSPHSLDSDSASKSADDGKRWGESTGTEFEESDDEPRKVSASDTIRERGDSFPDPAFEKERFAILQSQIDELERENKLLNCSLLTASGEAEKVDTLSIQLREVSQALDVANQENGQLESKLASMEQDLAKAKLAELKLAELKEQEGQIAELQNHLDTVTTQNGHLKRELEELSAKLAPSSSENIDAGDPVEPIAADKTAVGSTHDSGVLAANAQNQLEQTDPEFLKRFELRLKQEYKKRKQAQRELEQAETQRNEIAKALRLARVELKKFQPDAADPSQSAKQDTQLKHELAEAIENHRQSETRVGELQRTLADNEQELDLLKKKVGDLVAQRQQVEFNYQQLVQQSELANQSLTAEVKQLRAEAAAQETREPIIGTPVAEKVGSYRRRDELMKIVGIGPVILKKLNSIGVTTLSQIAAWEECDIAEVDAKLSLRNRVARERWVEQAIELTSAN